MHNRLRLASTAVAAGLLLPGCSTELPETSTPTVTITVTASATKNYDLNTENPCDVLDSDIGDTPATVPADKMKALAQCLQIMRSGKIAVVDFVGLDSNVAQKLTTDTKDVLSLASEGLINNTVQVVQPNEKARSDLQRFADTACLKIDVGGEKLQNIVQRTMPELYAENDRIVNLFPQSMCTLGDTKQTSGGYYAGGKNVVIFNVKNELPQPPKNFSKTDTLPGSNVVQPIAHEIFHSFYLFHAGLVVTPFNSNGSANTDNLIVKNSFKEYGDWNLQGCAIIDNNVTPKNGQPLLNPMQLHMLRTAERLLEEAPDNERKANKNEPVILTDTERGKFISVVLNRPVTVSGYGVKYTKLAVANPYGEQFYPGLYPGLYLMDEKGASTIRLGSFSPYEVAEIIDGSDIIKVIPQITDNGIISVTVKVQTAPANVSPAQKA